MADDLAEDFAHECAIRDSYARRLVDFRPQERLVRTELMFPEVGLRADMKTVDTNNVLRVWEFKIQADYNGLGQVLTYLAMERKCSPGRQVRAVLAAFEFADSIIEANEILNLGIEMITLPSMLRRAGTVPSQVVDADNIPFIPPAVEPAES
ncbi:hypothetical protein [Streptomyces qinglanensis]|uniref:Uncharacterized protein n=1 Tax=Streptomyces qinglanensis TaxID=943816 RepID=A0A1H9PIS2_9ACTN|nr:hypothetical protein [Streptomyces qinglanensis]SER47463.1 hypothetical protein SAMN05421870_10210 [Streptomyces qinglanensis]